MAISLISLFKSVSTKSRVAMTGEITLRGRVLPVGGIKEKVLAAKRAGITTVILPKRNEKDLVDVPEKAKKDLSFKLVERVDEILPIAFETKNKSKIKKRGK
jgi:ATP-dependent Lon protease